MIYPVRALRAGASGYLTKLSHPTELFQAIRQITAGGQYVSTEIANHLATNSFSINNNREVCDKLSDRELDVLVLLVSGKGTTEIARALRLGRSTVNCYRHRILTALQVGSCVELVHVAKQLHLID
ncbi:MAG: response regulator transcription factor [Gammaproteobacteria bacterium]|nr:response regulator transcription factor [Gammaproteobacteria bacterium]